MASQTAIILAAGLGKRMKSALPKVLHPVAGRPLLHYPVRAALDAGCDDVVVVVGHGRDQVQQYLQNAFDTRVRTVVQETQRGTGDAARVGVAALGKNGDSTVVVFYGDVPLIEAADLRLVMEHKKASHAPLAIATCMVADPTGYGRIIRDERRKVVAIREQRDLENDDQRAIREINPGIYVAQITWLRAMLESLEAKNAQGELYMTDVVERASKRGEHVTAIDAREAVLFGVNDRVQLFEAEKRMHRRIRAKHQRAGVTVRGGALIDDSVEIEPDAHVDTNAVLRGQTRVGAAAHIGVGAVLVDVVVGAGAVIKPYSVLEKSRVGERARVGPFSHLREGSELGEEVHVGNFVETKQTRMAKGAKANHLAYLGDGVVGERANVGAGTIFCNYDGVRKHVTTIGKDAFIGSDSQLVAPVTVGEGAYVATGTTVTRDVPKDALAIARPKQENKEGYAPKLKARMRAQAEADGKKK
jgi:bifunctional UDP-N-acetylglucosamine pyrophosphorylase/glucosamine-1-phosphate N-acetyltransferase